MKSKEHHFAVTNRGIEYDPLYVQLLHHCSGKGNCNRGDRISMQRIGQGGV